MTMLATAGCTGSGRVADAHNNGAQIPLYRENGLEMESNNRTNASKTSAVCVEDRMFGKMDFSGNPLPKGMYENCHFADCNFADTALSGYEFCDCTFTRCNLSSARLTQTHLSDAKFEDCKMLGTSFEPDSGFRLSFSFENCLLSYASFCKTKIKKTVFRNTQLHEADFTECDLSGALFDRCDLARALFSHTNIEKADFSTAYNYSIDPEINRMKKAKFSLPAVLGLLDKYGIEIATV